MPRDGGLARLRGTCEGETVFVLANGPSVRTHDLRLLRGKRVIGVNASPLLDREFGFRSDYYVVSDLRFISHPQKRDIAVNLPCESTVRVLREELRDVDEPRLAGRTHYVKALGKNGFSDDLRRGFYFGCSTTMLGVQLAFHLGATRIVLLGNDLRYAKERPRFYAEDAPQEHDPFLSVQIWNVRNAWRELQERGVEMLICTRESNLAPYVPYASFEQVVASAVTNTPR